MINAAPSFFATAAWVVACAVLTTSMIERPWALLLGGLLGYLLSQMLHQRATIRQLLVRLQVLESRGLTVSSAAAADERPSPAESRSPAAAAQDSEAASQVSSEIGPAISPGQSASVSVTVAPVAARAEPVPPSAPGLIERGIGEALAWLRRGNPLARAGIVVLFFGAAFLARYSADRGLLPLEFRLVGLAVGAIALLGIGWRLRVRRRLFGQTLQGGGIAGFYLTVFAAMRLYDLLPQSVALMLLIAVTLASAVLAVAQNSLSLAVIGTAGGFLAPVLLSTGGGSHIALFSYYTVLNLGVFAVAWFRAWRVLNLVGFVFTFGITGAFRALSYSQDKLVSTDAFLLLYFLMYVAVSVLFSLRQKPRLKGYVSGSLVFGLPVVVFTVHASLVSDRPYALAFSALGFGLFYLALAYGLFRSGRDNLRLLAEAFGALGIIFASLAIPLAFDRETTAAMWAVEGAGLLWLGLRQERFVARAFGALLQLAGGLGYLAGAAGLASNVAVLNSAAIGTAMLAVAGLLSSWWLFRQRDLLTRYEAWGERLAGLWGMAWWLFGGLAEIDRSVSSRYDYGAAMLFVALSIGGLFLIGQRLVWPLAQRVSMALWPLSVFFGLLGAAGLNHPGAEFGLLAWAVLLAVAYLMLWRLQDNDDELTTPAIPWLHALSWWMLALVVAWELDWRIGRSLIGSLADVWPVLPWGLVCAALLWTAVLGLPRWPVGQHADLYRMRAGVPLAAAAVVWIVGVSLSQSGSSGLPYIPLLNPLDVSIAVVLLSLARWWMMLSRRQRGRIWSGDPRLLWAALAALIFLWLNSALVRALHQMLGTPLSFRGVMHSFLVQASLSIFWSLAGLGAIFVAAKRAWRPVWLAGAALMAIVVVKLFVIDLDGRGGLARIVSFMSVGGVLLLAGYLSPLPPARQSTHEESP